MSKYELAITYHSQQTPEVAGELSAEAAICLRSALAVFNRAALSHDHRAIEQALETLKPTIDQKPEGVMLSCPRPSCEVEYRYDQMDLLFGTFDTSSADLADCIEQ